MLADIKIPYTDCHFCNSNDLIYGYRQFKDEDNVKIECECRKCGRIFFKVVNGEEYEMVRKMDKKAKE